MVPLMALLLVISRHWGQFQALFGFGKEPARYELTLRPDPLPTGYIAFVFISIFFLEMLPYFEEYRRAKKARDKKA